MKTHRYAISFLAIIIFALFFSSAALAQRWRYHSYREYHRNYYPQAYFSHSRPYASIHFGDYYYRYQRGYFYRPYGAVFQIVFPPFGIRIATLPFGYRSFYVGPDPYYYYNGIFYRPYANEYKVIPPPLGAVVDELPPGARVKVIDGRKYYEFNGTYYEEQINQYNELSYKVVGTDGVLNTEDTVQLSLNIGERINSLPPNSRPVVIEGEKLYSTPSGLYYKEVIAGNKVFYELVGK